MNFACNKCDTRYTIADEKLRGKVLKIRCRNCSALITVRDPASAQPRARSTFGSGMYRRASGSGMAGRRTASSDSIRAVGKRVARPIAEARRQPAAGSWDTAAAPAGRAAPGAVARKRGYGHDVDGPPGVAPRRPQAPAARAPDPFEEARRYRWFVSVEAGELGPISFQELRERVEAGEADKVSFGWREGLPDWKLLAEIEELKPLFAGPAMVAPGLADLSDLAEEDADEIQGERTVVADPAQLQAVMGGLPEADHEIVEEDDDSANLSALASGAVTVGSPALPHALGSDGSLDLRIGAPALRAPGAKAAPPGIPAPVAPPVLAAGSPPSLAGAAARAAIPKVPPPSDSGPAPLQPILEPSIPAMGPPPEAVLSAAVVSSVPAETAVPSGSSPVVPIAAVADPARKPKTALWAVLAAMLGAAVTAGVLLFVFLGTDILGGDDSDDDTVAEVEDEADDDDSAEADDDEADDDDSAEADDDDGVTGETDDGAMVFAPDVVSGDKGAATARPGPGKKGPKTTKTSDAVPDYASIYSSGTKVGTGAAGASLTSKPKPTRSTIGSAEISSVVSKNRGAIKLCYERALKKGEGEGGGKATVIVTVRGSGTVKKVAVAPPYSGGFFGECLRTTITRWKFPPFAGDEVTFKWPIILESGA